MGTVEIQRIIKKPHGGLADQVPAIYSRKAIEDLAKPHTDQVGRSPDYDDDVVVVLTPGGR